MFGHFYIYTNVNPLVGFLNSDTHEDIFARWAIQIWALNVGIQQHIQGTKNTAADGLSRTIFNASCTSTSLTSALKEQVSHHEHDHREWFWKSEKGGYEAWLEDMTEERWKRVIEQDHDAPVGWVSFAGVKGPEELTSKLPESLSILMRRDGPLETEMKPEH